MTVHTPPSEPWGVIRFAGENHFYEQVAGTWRAVLFGVGPVAVTPALLQAIERDLEHQRAKAPD